MTWNFKTIGQPWPGGAVRPAPAEFSTCFDRIGLRITNGLMAGLVVAATLVVSPAMVGSSAFCDGSAEAAHRAPLVVGLDKETSAHVQRIVEDFREDLRILSKS